MHIEKATDADLDGILDLQAANQIDRGGSLSASLPRSQVAAMLQAMPLIVTRDSDPVEGFLMTSSRAMDADIPIVQTMFAAYQGSPDAYIYGPVCVGENMRGKGLAQAMFEKLRAFEPGREGILFVRSDNEASLRAHAKMGMRDVAAFKHDGLDFVVFSYIG
jgi:predicted GNAT superfamily acetyltransferase